MQFLLPRFKLWVDCPSNHHPGYTHTHSLIFNMLFSSMARALNGGLPTDNVPSPSLSAQHLYICPQLSCPVTFCEAQWSCCPRGFQISLPSIFPSCLLLSPRNLEVPPLSFCPAIGCWHLYRSIKNQLGTWTLACGHPDSRSKHQTTPSTEPPQRLHLEAF